MNYNEILQSTKYVKSKINTVPEIGIILGSGLGGLAKCIENSICIPYADIPNFVTSTAPGHVGQFIVGNLGNKNVICMQGRLHYYEGHNLQDIVLPIRVMKLLGVKTLIVTNASGGINTLFNVGDLMLIDDHINLMGINPLIGANIPQLGTRFFDMTFAYTPKLKEIAINSAQKLNIKLNRGVYLATSGPSYETPAEIKMFRTLGADAVGMSTVPEVLTASHCKMNVLAISLITNMAAGIIEKELSEDEVIEIGNKCSTLLQNLIEDIIKSI